MSHSRFSPMARYEMANTFSITAYDPNTGEVGVAVQTHQMSVGRIVTWARPGVGAVATQSLANVSYGPRGLTLMADGVAPADAVRLLTEDDPDASHRQLAMINAQGEGHAFTGEHCIVYAGHHIGEGYTVQANMMNGPDVISAMREAYEGADGDLAAQMMAAMHAAQEAGGDIRGMQSAAILIVPKRDDNTPEWATTYDLRVDEHADPVNELARLVRMRRAQWVSAAGDEALAEGDKQTALHLWADARAMAPELEEVAFWQAMALADTGNDVAGAVAIFQPVFKNDPLRSQWIDLITRLKAADLITREGAGDEFVAALNA